MGTVTRFYCQLCGIACRCRENPVTVAAGGWPTTLLGLKPTPEAPLEISHKYLAAAGASAMGRVSQTRNIRSLLRRPQSFAPIA